MAQSKTVLVTGSNRGIGLEFVTQYAAAGWDVIATSRSPDDDEALQALAEKHSGVTIEQLDVTDSGEVSALAEKLKGTPIDLLINNAGIIGDRQSQAWGRMDQEQFNQMVAINVFGPMKVSEAFAEHVGASEDKKIVVVSSTAGSIASLNRPTPLPYMAITKAAVNMAMRAAAMQLRDQGITVGMIMPGAVNTRMLRQAFGLSLTEAEAAEDFDYGSYATITTQESVSKMVKTIAGLDISKTGTFMNNDGTPIPW